MMYPCHRRQLHKLYNFQLSMAYVTLCLVSRQARNKQSFLISFDMSYYVRPMVEFLPVISLPIVFFKRSAATGGGKVCTKIVLNIAEAASNVLS